MADGSSDYDNTNSGVFFKPYDDQKLFGQGRMNVEGADTRIVVVNERVSRDGETMPVVYQRVGPLFANDKKGNDKAPDRSGPMDTHPDYRMAVWRGEKDGRPYFSLKISRKQSNGGSAGASNGGSSQSNEWGGDSISEDEIPF